MLRVSVRSGPGGPQSRPQALNSRQVTPSVEVRIRLEIPQGAVHTVLQRVYQR